MIANSLSLQKSVFKQTKEHFGSLDIVVNNAGIFDEINWEKLLKVNLVKNNIDSIILQKLSMVSLVVHSMQWS